MTQQGRNAERKRWRGSTTDSMHRYQGLEISSSTLIRTLPGTFASARRYICWNRNVRKKNCFLCLIALFSWSHFLNPLATRLCQPPGTIVYYSNVFKVFLCFAILLQWQLAPLLDCRLRFVFEQLEHHLKRSCLNDKIYSLSFVHSRSLSLTSIPPGTWSANSISTLHCKQCQ